MSNFVRAIAYAEALGHTEWPPMDKALFAMCHPNLLNGQAPVELSGNKVQVWGCAGFGVLQVGDHHIAVSVVSNYTSSGWMYRICADYFGLVAFYYTPGQDEPLPDWFNPHNLWVRAR